MVAAGIGVALVASAAQQTGYVLQALDARTVDARRPFVGGLVGLAARRRWRLGLALVAVGVALQLLALHLAPLTVVQPTLALGVVGLVVLGGRVLGEPARAADVLAAACIAAAVTVIAVASAAFRVGDGAVAATAVILAVLLAPAALGLLTRSSSGALLVAGAGGADAAAALCAERLVQALAATGWTVAAGWAALAAACVGGSLVLEMAALRSWQATRVGPVVLVCQVVLPALAAPVVAGERWGASTPVVLGCLAVVAVATARLAASAARARG